MTCEEFQAAHDPNDFAKFEAMSRTHRFLLFKHYATCEACRRFIHLMPGRPNAAAGDELADKDMADPELQEMMRNFALKAKENRK